MKVVQSIVISAVLCLSNSVVTMANVNGAVLVSQSSVIVTTDADGGQVQSTPFPL